jgi:tetratricopeptide (TPR) repeat protein
LASVYQQKGEHLEAERIYNLAVQQQPHHWYPLHALAVFQLERGRYDEAARLFRQVVRLLPDNASALTNLGSVYLLQGQLQAAAETYLHALELTPTADTQSNLATVYYYLGRLTDAVRLYQQALQQQPERYELHGNLADALRHTGELDAALRSYQLAFRLIEQQPTLDARALALKAHYADYVQHPQAADWMAQARAMDASNAEVWLLSAHLAARQQDIPQATAAIQKALQFGFPAKLLSSDPDLAPLVNDKNLQKSLQNGRNSL